MNDLFVSRAMFVMVILQWIQMSSQTMDNYIHTLYVDNEQKYYLSWKFDKKEIVFEVVVNTTDYVAFGLSSDGTLANSDIVIGEVDDRQSSLEDYHGSDNGTLEKDNIANWVLLSATEMNNNTNLTFKRELITNDPNDMDITSDTMRVIWAYGKGIFNEANFVVGYKSLHLLQIARPDVAIPDDAPKLIIAMNEISIPKKATTYLCRDFELPKYQQKMHIIKISPIVSKGNELMVHHMLLYSCQKKKAKRNSDKVHLCYDEKTPDIWEKCPMVVFGWAIGGTNFPLPEHVGIPLEVSTDPVTFLLEIHYDNPGRKSGVLDSSGFEMILTPDGRKFDAAIIEIGQVPFDPSYRYIQMIPPYQPYFKSSTVCLSKCIYDDYPPKNETSLMKIFAVLLHAHLLAKQIVFHHYRNGKELDNIASDRNYDFNYQEMVFLKKEVEILPGDDFKVECIYNSEKRRKFTWGGLSTTDEMCLAYVMYYPKMRTTNCLSAIAVDDIKWIESRLNPSNLSQFKNKEVAKMFEQTVNGVGRNSSLLTYCSDGSNITVRYQPAAKFLEILQYDMPHTTDTLISITDVTSKVGISVTTSVRSSLWIPLLASILPYFGVL